MMVIRRGDKGPSELGSALTVGTLWVSTIQRGTRAVNWLAREGSGSMEGAASYV